jgi:hypothetical protein
MPPLLCAIQERGPASRQPHDGRDGGRDRLVAVRRLAHEVPAQIAILRKGYGQCTIQ